MLENAIGAADFAARVYMRVQSRISSQKIGQTFFGARMYCDTKDFIQRRIYYFNMFEPNLSHYILNLVQDGDHVVDIGANVGYMTLLLSSAVGRTGSVVAIEASPATYAVLRKNLELNGVSNVTALNVAATDGPCMVEIVSGEKNNSGTNAIRRGASAGSASVKGDAISNLTEVQHQDTRFIKIDVEGSEAPILQDIITNIDSYPKLKAIAVEITPESAYLMREFQNKGFRIYGLPNNYRIGYLFVRKYLRETHEDGFVIKVPLETYSPEFRDFVFERL
jgi:FkbM family methyltransferase